MQYRGLTLDAFQAQAIDHLADGRSVLVSAPTGTGKTIIADWIVEEALNTGKRVIYTAPIKALSNQKYRDYTRLYGEEKVGLVTGDLVINRDAPCLVMTTEILRNILLAGEPMDDLLAVIVDEIHFLDDRERGTTWEEVLIYLPPSVQIVGLSATLSNLEDFSAWLSHVRGSEVAVVKETKRAVPLMFHYASRDLGMHSPEEFHTRWKRKKGQSQEYQPRGRGRRGRGRDRNQKKQRRPMRRTRDLDCFEMVYDAGLLPYLYFVFSRKDTERYARALADYLETSLLTDEEQARMDARLAKAGGELGNTLDRELREIYRKGVAFHHAGLHVQLKQLVEELYENKLIMVLYCTSTFALGINMPARTAVFDGLKKYDGRSFAPLNSRQFMQKAGRAGRRGMDDTGHVVIRMDVDEYEELKPQMDGYLKRDTEPVRSGFNLSWNSIVNLLARHDEEHIRTIIDKSFLAWHLSRQVDRQLARAETLEAEPGVEKRGRNKDLKEARRLRKRADRDESRCWNEFRGKVGFLKVIGYLADDESFNAGANILQHVQIAEIFTTELVLNGIFEDIEPANAFGLLTAIVANLPRGVETNFHLTREDRRFAHAVNQLLHGEAVQGADSLGDTETTFTPELIPIGRAWAEGKSLEDVMFMVVSPTDISGTLISAFRRAKDLAGQLRDVYGDIPETKKMFGDLIKKTGRDEVEVVG